MSFTKGSVRGSGSCPSLNRIASTLPFGLTAKDAGLLHPDIDAVGQRLSPLYLTRFSYTPANWAKLIFKDPEDRQAAAKQHIEAVGGKLHGFCYAFGDHDAYALYEAPDNVSMAAGDGDYHWRRAEFLADDCLANRGPADPLTGRSAMLLNFRRREQRGTSTHKSSLNQIFTS